MDKQLLIDAGIDYNNAMVRLGNNSSLYERILEAFLDDKCYEELRDVVASGDYSQLFSKAHALKGLSGNLDLTGVYQATCILAEYTRNNDAIEKERVEPLFAEIEKYYHQSVDAIKRALK